MIIGGKTGNSVIENSVQNYSSVSIHQNKSYVLNCSGSSEHCLQRVEAG